MKMRMDAAPRGKKGKQKHDGMPHVDTVVCPYMRAAYITASAASVASQEAPAPSLEYFTCQGFACPKFTPTHSDAEPGSKWHGIGTCGSN